MRSELLQKQCEVVKRKEKKCIRRDISFHVLSSESKLCHTVDLECSSRVCNYLSPASARAKRVASAEYSSTLSRSIRKFPFDLAWKVPCNVIQCDVILCGRIQ